jgi:hypothetical protein
MIAMPTPMYRSGCLLKKSIVAIGRGLKLLLADLFAAHEAFRRIDVEPLNSSHWRPQAFPSIR